MLRTLSILALMAGLAAGPSAAVAEAPRSAEASDQSTGRPDAHSQLERILSIVAAALGGFSSWLLISSTLYLVERRRLLAFLVAVLNNRLRDCNEYVDWVDSVCDKTLKPEHVVKTAANVTPNDLDALRGTRELQLRLLSQKELVRALKAEDAIWEIEVLTAAFGETLREYLDSQRVLNEQDVEFQKERANRIARLVKLLPDKIRSLTDLPTDYRGRVTADGLVRADSAERELPGGQAKVAAG